MEHIVTWELPNGLPIIPYFYLFLLYISFLLPIFKGVDYPVQPNYPVQPPVQPPVHPPAYNEPLHVPVSFYPDNVYSTSTGNGVVAQINRDLDNFDYALTEALDGNRYFNRVHDPTIPPAPGMVQVSIYPEREKGFMMSMNS